jgi:hypothetical protein
MTDKAFQWSLTIVTILVLIWLIAGIILYYYMPFILVLFSAIVVELGVAIILLHFWGKDYMGRRL